MQNQQPRPPRLDLHLPIRFFSTDGLKTGYSVNVSESGMLAVFDTLVDHWLEGEISFFVEDDGRQFSIKARVARTNGREAGMHFHPQSDAHKLAISKLLALAEAKKQPARNS